MPTWTDDLTSRTIDDIMRIQEENRAWHKQVRIRASELTNSRLAKCISAEEYAVGRRVSIAESQECQRRSAVLLNEVMNRRSLRA